MDNSFSLSSTTRGGDSLSSPSPNLSSNLQAEVNLEADHKPLKLARKKMERVPPFFRNRKACKDVYEPVVVSLGPYHHGKSEHQEAELFKKHSLDAFISESHNNKNKFFYYGKILEQIHFIRGCYAEVDQYDDQALAWMMLHDACFFIYLIKIALIKSSFWRTRFVTYSSYFGPGRQILIYSDLNKQENQIPLCVCEYLMCLQSGDGESSIWNKLFHEYMNYVFPAIVALSDLPPWAGDTRKKPVHYLDAVRIYLMSPLKSLYKRNSKLFVERGGYDCKIFEDANYQFRSVTNLRAKGILFKRSNPTVMTKDQIRFSSHSFHGQLQLPPLIFGIHSFVMYSNLIAYEMSFPTRISNGQFVSSFINFMKSLIESPNDAKILREGGILFSMIGGDDEVVKLIKDLDTFGLENLFVFSELKNDIELHCSNKAKTWKAELIHGYFRSPVTAFALFTAFCLCCLAFLQTFFTIRPTG